MISTKILMPYHTGRLYQATVSFGSMSSVTSHDATTEEIAALQGVAKTMTNSVAFHDDPASAPVDQVIMTDSLSAPS